MPELELLVDSWDEPLQEGGFLRHVKGELFSAVQDVADWLMRYDAARLAGGVPRSESAVPEPVGETVEPEVEVAEEPAANAMAGAPAKTASIDEWRAYAASQGLETKGLKTKQQIQAAVREFLLNS